MPWGRGFSANGMRPARGASDSETTGSRVEFEMAKKQDNKTQVASAEAPLLDAVKHLISQKEPNLDPEFTTDL